MNLFAHIDNYCERTDPSLWSEPLNALSNLAFLIAAAMLWHWARDKPLRNELRALAVLIAFIGICSGLFHVFGTVWGMLLDVGGIALFIFAYIHCYLRQLAQWPLWACWLGVLIFIAEDRGLAKFTSMVGGFGLNGSEGYLLPAATLAAFAIWSRHFDKAATPWLSAATSIFVVSLSLRFVDMNLCAAWTFGTHFAWHLLNALVLYCCVRALAAANGRDPQCDPNSDSKALSQD